MAEVKLWTDKAGQAHVEDCQSALPHARALCVLSAARRGGGGGGAHARARAGLFAILKAVEHLENAYIQDWVRPEEYEQQCDRLISQYRALYSASLRQQVRGVGRRPGGAVHARRRSSQHAQVGSLESFAARFNMIVPKALQRLATGMAATREHSMPTCVALALALRGRCSIKRDGGRRAGRPARAATPTVQSWRPPRR